MYDTRHFYDICLFELERNITFGDNVKVLEIAPKGFKPLDYAKRVKIAEWGTTDAREMSVHLQKANFVIRRDEVCDVDEEEN